MKFFKIMLLTFALVLSYSNVSIAGDHRHKGMKEGHTCKKECARECSGDEKCIEKCIEDCKEKHEEMGKGEYCDKPHKTKEEAEKCKKPHRKACDKKAGKHGYLGKGHGDYKAKLEGILGSLELSEKQTGQVEKLKESYKKKTEKIMGKLKEAKKALRGQHMSDDVNMRKVKKLVRKIEKLQGDLKIFRFEKMEDLKDILNEEQLKKYKDSFKRRGSGRQMPMGHPPMNPCSMKNPCSKT